MVSREVLLGWTENTSTLGVILFHEAAHWIKAEHFSYIEEESHGLMWVVIADLLSWVTFDDYGASHWCDYHNDNLRGKTQSLIQGAVHEGIEKIDKIVETRAISVLDIVAIASETYGAILLKIEEDV